MSHTPEYQPKTGVRCSCRKGQQRDNCPSCEGTGWCIDFQAIRARINPARVTPTVSPYWVTGVQPPAAHQAHAALVGVTVPCTAHHVNFGGGCLNCGWGN